MENVLPKLRCVSSYLDIAFKISIFPSFYILIARLTLNSQVILTQLIISRNGLVLIDLHGAYWKLILFKNLFIWGV